MWGQPVDIPRFLYQEQQPQQGTHYDDDTMCPPFNDFSHIIEAAHITLSTTGPAAHSFNALNTSANDCSSLPVDSLTQGLLTPRGCSKCAHLGSIRETLKSVESSYLEEISQLKRMVNQIDVERVNAVNRVEQILLAFDRCRQHILSKNHETQILRGQLRQAEDNIQRSEYELDSVKHLHMRDIAFFNKREILFFFESEQGARAGIMSLEADWWPDLYAGFMSMWNPSHKLESLSLAFRWHDVPSLSFININKSSGTEEYSSLRDGLSPSPVPTRSPSITRYTETVRGSNMGVLSPALKGGLLTELRESKRNADQLNEELRGELNKKEGQISYLKLQLSILEENIRRLSQESIEGEKLGREMQDEIDDMLCTEVLLTQKCERHSLETQAMEERLEVMYFFIQQNSTFPEKLINSAIRIPAKEGIPAIKLIPEVSGRLPNLFHECSGIESCLQCGANGLPEDIVSLVSHTVADTVQSVIQGHLLPLKLSVESIRANSDELHRTMRKAVQDSCRDADPSNLIIEELKKEFGIFATDIKNILPNYTSLLNARDEKADIANLRSTLKKVARLMSHNAKVMDDKLNDILLCQSAVARQRAVTDVLSPGEGTMNDVVSQGASPNLTSCGVGELTTIAPLSGKEKMTPPKSRHVRFNLTHYDSSLPSEISDNALFNTPVSLSHEWDVEVSDDESVPPPPASSLRRKTPYDVDDA